MKCKHLKMAAAGTLVLSMLMTGGCERMVRAQVAAELRKEDGSGSASGKDAARENTGDQPAELTVAQQVMAPKRYQSEFDEEVPVAAEDGTSTHTLKVSVTADAEVAVPDVDAIYLKQVSSDSGDIQKMKEWLEILEQISADGSLETGSTDGAERAENTSPGDGIYSGTAALWDNTYMYRMAAVTDESNYANAPVFIVDRTWEGEELSIAEADLTDEECLSLESQAGEQALKLLEKLGIKGFKIGFYEEEPVSYSLPDGSLNETKSVICILERVADGVPVNSVDESLYPFYRETDRAAWENLDGQGQSSIWPQERLEVNMFSNNELHRMIWQNPVRISDYSDEKQFLLPFDEICRIFENTIGNHLAQNAVSADYDTLTVYPDMEDEKIELRITKVKLGYMRIRDEEAGSGGILIPVWDFYGTSERDYTLSKANASYFTIDARDGTVIRRYYGY